MLKDNPMRTGDLDYTPVNSIFDHAPQEEYKLDTTKATTYKPDAFELKLARKEQQEHEAKIQLIINRMMGKV